MASKNVCDLIVEILGDIGVKTVFGIPGDAVDRVVEAIRKQDRLDFIHVRHEESGAFAAAAQAKLSGQLGVCLGTAGPGAIHLLNGLYDAKLDHAPVLAITGQVPTKMIGMGSHQEVNLEALFNDVCVYNRTIVNPEQLPEILIHACNEAISNRGVAHLSIPVDIALKDVELPDRKNYSMFSHVEKHPVAEDVEKAAEILNNAGKVAILAGYGAKDAAPELLQTAGLLGAPIIKALRGKDIIPDEHPYSLGGLGLLGTGPAVHAMHNCDALLMVGTDFPYSEFYPKDIPVIQIDSEAERLGKRIPVEQGLIGDARLTLQILNTHISRKTDTSFLESHQEKMKAWFEKIQKEEISNDEPVHPQALAYAISTLADENAVICCDTGEVTVWGARNFRLRGSQRFTLSGGLASMAYAMSAAIGAQFLYRDKQVIALCGDGGFSMLMQDFLTAVTYRLPIKVFVFNNTKLGLIKMEQEVLGYPEYETGLKDFNYAEFAKLCGGDGIRVEKTGDLHTAIGTAFGSSKPFVVDVCVNPDEKTIPPEITIKQAYGFGIAKIKEFFGLGDKGKP